MRGVLSLAGALALPILLADGSPFPQRNLIVFLAFCVIFVTLVLQGITLPPLIRALGLAGAAGPNSEEWDARRIVIETALSHLEKAKDNDSGSLSIYEDLIEHYRQRLANLQIRNGSRAGSADDDRQLGLSLEAMRIERETVIRLRDEGRINDEVMRRIERELDLAESRITAEGDVIG
jgi:CPA1 family monovalent cation:H+ antiporter